MFQFKNTGLGIKEPDTSNALPNTFGKVRTFKEDLQNFEKGAPTIDVSEETAILPPETKKPPAEAPLPKEESPTQTISAAPTAEQAVDNPFQSVPTPPPLSSPNPGLPSFKSSPSRSFFSEKPVSQESFLPKPAENKPPAQKKPKGGLLLALSIVLIVVAAGAGFYYYWFHIRSSSSAVPSAPATSAPLTTPQAESPASSDSQNKNIRQLVVDISQNPLAIKDALQNFSADFSSSSSDGNIAEIKLITKDNQPIGKKDFAAGFGLTIPDAVLMKLSEDYSLFAVKGNSNVRLGLVFKTVTSAGLTDEMKNWEPKLTTDLGSLYLSPNAAPADISFSSSQYKNADIRYFNFSSPADTSLDYSVISNFLVIGTSKDATRSILDYMSEK